MQHIIKQDAQNLNNPSLYYQQLFLNHIQRRRDILPNLNQNTIMPIKRNKNENNISSNLNIKRTSTYLKSINNQLALSPQKLIKRSSIAYPSKFKKIKI